MNRPLTLTDVEALANERLDPDWREYFAGGAGDERTLRDNVAAFRAWHLRQRVLCGIDTVSTAATVLGRELAVPIVVAPVAHQLMAYPDGDVGTARAPVAAGAALFLTVDLPVVGSRDRERRVRWTFPEDALPVVRCGSRPRLRRPL